MGVSAGEGESIRNREKERENVIARGCERGWERECESEWEIECEREK